MAGAISHLDGQSQRSKGQNNPRGDGLVLETYELVFTLIKKYAQIWYRHSSFDCTLLHDTPQIVHFLQDPPPAKRL